MQTRNRLRDPYTMKVQEFETDTHLQYRGPQNWDLWASFMYKAFNFIDIEPIGNTMASTYLNSACFFTELC